MNPSYIKVSSKRISSHRPVPFCSIVGLILIIFIALFLPHAAASEPGADPLEQVRLQLKWTHQFQFAGYYIAEEKGYYRDAGLNVTIMEGSGDINPVDRVTKGVADIGVGTSEIALERAKGSPVVVIADIFQHSPLIFLVREDSGISSIHDLVGKDVMMEAGSEELIAYLIHEGIAPEKVHIIPNTNNISALIAGDIQAMSSYSTTEPYLLDKKGIKFLSFTPRSSGIDFYGDNLFTSESYLKEHPDSVKKFLESSRLGWEYALDNPNETADLILAKYNPGLEKEQLLFENNQMTRLILPDVVQIGYMNPGRWNNIIEIYEELGMIKEPFPLNNFLYNPNPKQDLTLYILSIVILGIIAIFCGYAFVYYHRLNRSLKNEIEERKRVEESLHMVSKKLTLLSSITRHDINNQITVLTGYLSIIEKKHPDDRYSEYLKKAAIAAQHISTIIQFTREYESIGINDPSWQDCQNLIDIAAREAPLLQVKVRNDIPAGSEIFADPLVVKVFYNLIDNALRYGVKITTIRFTVEECGEHHLIVCEDDGGGILTHEKEKIFERGFGKNTGLGLALSREILDITGITIIETGEPGKGARFEISVPNEKWRSGKPAVSI